MRSIKSFIEINILILIFCPILIMGIVACIYQLNPLYIYSNLGTFQPYSVYTIDPNIGYTKQALGHLAAKMWLSGNIPWWNPFEGVGMPLAGEMQSAAFSPFTLLLYFSQGVTFLHLTFQIISGLGTFLFLRKLGISKNNALIGGLLFEFNGTFAWLANAVINPIPFLPFLLYGLECMIDHSKFNQKGSWRIFAISLALSIYAGFPEVAYINVIFVLAYSLIRMLSLTSQQNFALIRKGIIGISVGILLALPLIIAFLDYLANANTAGHLEGEFRYEYFTPRELSLLVMPDLYGHFFQLPSSKTSGAVGGYFSLISLFLGLWSVLNNSSKRAIKLFLIFWVIFCLGRAYGLEPFYFIFTHTPWLGYTNFIRYYNASTELAVITLAVLSLEELKIFKLRKGPFISYAFVFIAFLLGATIIANHPIYKTMVPPLWNWHGFRVQFLSSIAWAALSLLLTTFLVYKNRFFLLKILLVLDAILFFLIPLTYAPQQINFQGLGGVNYLQKHLGLQRFYTLGPLSPNYGSYFEIATISFDDLPAPQSWLNYILSNLDPYIKRTSWVHVNPTAPSPVNVFLKNINNFETTGVAYVLTDANTKLPLEIAYQNSFMHIYSLPHPASYFATDNNSCKIEVFSRTDLIAICSRPSLLLRRELFMPGWKATINGQEIPVEPSQDIFQKINLFPGENHIHFQFIPPFMQWGLLGFILGILSVILFPGKKSDIFTKNA